MFEFVKWCGNVWPPIPELQCFSCYYIRSTCYLDLWPGRLTARQASCDQLLYQIWET